MRAKVLLLLIAICSLPGVSQAQDPRWDETARAWEESARKFTAMGDTVAARDAWAQAATAWERDGDYRAALAPRVSDTPRVDELESLIRSLDAELASWRRAALTWRQASDVWKSAGDTLAARAAEERAFTALRRIAELENLHEEYSGELAGRRATLLDMPISPELRAELVARWEEVARSWELTAETWEKSGEPGKARVARIKADEARARIREIDPQYSPAPPPVVIARPIPEPPVVEEPPVEDPAIDIPELPPAPALPPDWMLTKEERELVRGALIWRQTAATWRVTALSRRQARDWEEALSAVSKMKESMRRATEFEEDVRKSYAAREAEISRQIAKALGEEPRTSDQILAALDALPTAARPLPPTVTGDAIALAPPELPEVEAARERRGFFDLEIGGPLPSTLTIRGRKVVDFGYNITHFLNEDPTRTAGNTQSSFNLNQELQVDVAGRVGRETNDHININIHYDDTQRGVNSVNNRTIGVDFVGVPHKASWGTYQYDADFGDISVTLPGSEFAFYNKSLFGVTANLNVTDLNLGPVKADRVNLLLIGSQTKGVSASKEFTLSGERVIENIKDISFVRDKFLRIEPDTTRWPISQVIVYKDDQNGANNEGTVPFVAQGSGQTAGFAHSGAWNKLVAGIDYTLDLNTAELELLSTLGPNDLLAVGYTNSAGQSFGGVLPNRLIRVPTDTTQAARSAFRAHELRNRYFLQRRRIKRNDPSFVFEIRDALGFAQTSKIGGIPRTYLQLFGFDRDRDDKVDVELIDYDFGVIKPVDTAPFMATGNREVDNPNIYQRDDVTDADNKYTFHIEYSSDQPQEIFTLGFDIIKGSDIVYVDGVVVTRDVDYFIDYEAGILTFLNPAIVKPTSKIRVDYEFLPFGGQFERTLVGTRLDVNVNSALSFGSTLLYDFSAAAKEIPSIFGDRPTQNAIIELDARLQLMPLLFGFLDRNGPSTRLASLRKNFRLDLGAEWAWATHSPNTFGTAMLEDFEAIENIVGASFGRTAWAPAAQPPANAQLAVEANRRGRVAFSTRDNFGHRTLAQVESGERQQSLQMDLSFAPGETWVAIRQPLSTAAINFRDITSMEFFVSGLPQNVRAFVDVGLISEDADADGILDSEDNGIDNRPNTNDAGENNNILNVGEDVGVTFNFPHRVDVFGAQDGALTTEDMDGDFKLDQNEAFFRIGELKSNAEIESKTITGVDNSTWLLFRAPWRIGQAVGPADSAVVKHLRLVFVRTDGLDTAFTIFSDALNFRGNRFSGASGDSRIVLLPRNTQNDPNYVRPPRTEIPQTEVTPKEQALGIRWNLGPNDSATVVQGLSKKADLGDYRRLSFFFAGDANQETFSLFLVSDPENHIEIRKRVTTGSDVGGIDGPPQLPVWQKIDVDLEPIRQVTINNILGTGDTRVTFVTNDYTVVITGQPSLGRSPSLSNINQMWLRIQNHEGTSDSGEVWINDIYAAEPIEASAMASKASFSTGWSDIFSLSGAWRDVPGKFHGVGFINNPQAGTFDEISNQSMSLSATLALHRLLPSSWGLLLPLSASWSRATQSVDPDRVENTLKSNLGKTQSENQSYTATVQFWKLPAINLNYGRATSTTDFRLEDRSSLTSNLNANTAYSYVFPQKLFGVLPTGKFLSMSASYAFAQGRSKASFGPNSGIQTQNSRVASHGANFAVTSTPISPLSLSYNFNMGFADQRTLNITEGYRGMTNRNHAVNATLSLPTKFGISPGISFSGNYSENFNRVTFGGRAKDIGLGGNFNINVGLDPSAWTRLLSFITARYSYSLSSNASYRNLNTGIGITDIFGDYVGERLFPWGSSKRIGLGTEGVTGARSSGSTSNVHNLSGDIRTFRWLNTSYSMSMTRNEGASLSTLSISDGINATLNNRLDLGQALPGWKIFRSSYLTGAIGYGRNENAAARSNSLSPSLNWNMQWSDALNVTFNMGYNRSTNAPLTAPSLKTISQSLSPAMGFTYYFDLPVPEAFKLPGIGTLSALNRRVQLSGGANATFTEAKQDVRKTTDQNNYGLNLSLGYRIASNLEMSASGSGSWIQNKLANQNDQFTIGAGGRVEWRF